MQALPRPVELSAYAESQDDSSVVRANLMPFSIDYDGPAPVSRYMVVRSASDTESPSELEHSKLSAALVSAFRGRTIHGTPITVPAGYKAHVVEVPTEVELLAAQATSFGASTPKATSSSQHESKRRRTEAHQQETPFAESALRRSPRKMAATSSTSTAARAKFTTMKSFSMDDSDDDEAQEDEEKDLTWDAAIQDDAANHEPVLDLEGSLDAATLASTGNGLATEPGNEQQIAKQLQIGASCGEHIVIWSPDGPVDEGDDAYIRTLREYLGVIAPALHTS
ncbi:PHOSPHATIDYLINOSITOL N-ACETYLGLUCOSAMINYLTRANSFERASE SUBUNIT P (DOWN SYNDROME CRITICAL REGION PROTEIN 5)-RELATED [Ceraceosorus bombacis]|uniref:PHOSPHATIDYLINOSITOL N-ACETYLGLUCOSAMINYLTRANSFERASE SUBUNIT P (DOWN SYNDROME CRITICAL REGION PROTEIN 5)-RELATED n=1 Tax=Ceraceosorus bombacis TaxID=401625 RepID=A0A0P1BJ18_9BASI|nr:PHOSPHATIDYLINOSITOL N-ACETYLGLUCOSAMINYLTRANSFERASE SUBUNIT P (DOWN SYNDROME CRITICAL REGION PROTEIN 5)-RELATED [Ceraceosorus bombacis]